MRGLREPLGEFEAAGALRGHFRHRWQGGEFQFAAIRRGVAVVRIAADGDLAVFDFAVDDAHAEVRIVVVADGLLRIAELADVIHRVNACGQFLRRADGFIELGGQIDEGLGADVTTGDAVVAVRRPAERAAAVKDAGERVVVAHGDRLGFVIVAPCAGEREAEESASDDVDLVIDLIEDVLLVVALLHVHAAEREHAGADDLITTLKHGLRRQQIARDLLGDEAVVGFVFVERINHPIAIPRSIQKRCIPHATDAVRITHDIEPVPRPALAEAFGLEECVHDLREGDVIGGRIAQEGLDLGLRRRQAAQIEGRTANKRRTGGIADGTEVFLFETSENEAVEVVLRPRRVFRGWNSRTLEPLVGPRRGVVVFLGGEGRNAKQEQCGDLKDAAMTIHDWCFEKIGSVGLVV